MGERAERRRRVERHLAWVAWLAFMIASGCAHVETDAPRPALPDELGYTQRVADLLRGVGPEARVAVAQPYDGESGDITALGRKWQAGIEHAARQSGKNLVARGELAVLIEDMEAFGSEERADDIWNKLEADVLVCGRYYFRDAAAGGQGGERIDLYLQAFRTTDGGIIGTERWDEPATEEMWDLAARVKGNVYYRNLPREPGLGAPDSAAIPLDARLDRDPPRYSPGEDVEIEVRTDPGMHVYLLCLQADETVTLLYPNRIMPDRPLTDGLLRFPPAGIVSGNRVRVQLQTLEPGKPCFEEIQVVVSRSPIDFSFLPFPEGQVFSGARGGDIRRVRDVLQRSTGWREARLRYLVVPTAPSPSN